MIAIICAGDRHRRRLGVGGHAGLPADYERHRAAALLLLERPLPGAGPAGGSAASRAAQPAQLRLDGLRGALSGSGFVFGVATDFAVLGSLASTSIFENR
jgi:hypothetical protein